LENHSKTSSEEEKMNQSSNPIGNQKDLSQFIWSIGLIVFFICGCIAGYCLHFGMDIKDYNQRCVDFCSWKLNDTCPVQAYGTNYNFDINWGGGLYELEGEMEENKTGVS